jgi:hypothetical protein
MQSSFFTERNVRKETMLPVSGIPVHSSAVATQSPVHVGACYIFHPIAALNLGAGATMGVSPHLLHIQFSNDSSQPITRIVIALNDGRTVVDAGKFAPGVEISHAIDLGPGDADSCSIASATFANGSEWDVDRGYVPALTADAK